MYFRLKLRHGAQHMEQQASGRIPRVDVLIEHLKVDLLTCEFLRDRYFLSYLRTVSCAMN